ncbi:MAG: hypothetical protein HY554_09915 [Elusimicrobia bacterium]|nr:hypothetical protein [Elusimicrobiota bacterium]
MTQEKLVQYCVPARHEPGLLLRVTQILAKAGIPVTGLLTECHGDLQLIRFIVDREDALARRLLEDEGFEAFARPVFALELGGGPEERGRVARCLADEDLGALNVYGAPDGARTAELVLTVERPERARLVLSRRPKGPAAGSQEEP